jgi:hypothetical protein
VTSVQYRVDMAEDGLCVGVLLANRTAKPLSYLGRVRCEVLKMGESGRWNARPRPFLQ